MGVRRMASVSRSLDCGMTVAFVAVTDGYWYDVAQAYTEQVLGSEKVQMVAEKTKENARKTTERAKR